MTNERLTTAEVARLLGVKHETVYAYVARGLLQRLDAVAGERGSRFDRREIDNFASGTPRRKPSHPELVISTAVTSLANGALSYRGHHIGRLVDQPFESVAELLWTAKLPSVPPRWRTEPADRTMVQQAQALVADAPPADRLRVALAVLGALDPLQHDLRPDAALATGRRLIAALLGVRRTESAADAVARTLALPARWRPSVDRALVLLADHELATSTVAVRVAASVRAGLAACLSSGLAAVSGSLHGSASASVHALLADAAALGTGPAVAARLQQGGSLPGLGHSVYRSGDPRFGLLMANLTAVAAATARSKKRLAVVESVLELATSRATSFANIDFALGAFTFLSEVSPSGGEYVFAAARLAGWVAHATEEYGEEPLRFRVRSGR